MKITCDFCKTEYNVQSRPGSSVRCAICGNTWTVPAPARKNAFLMFFASLCALLSVIVFAVAIVVTHKPDPDRDAPLIARVSGHEIITNDDGVRHLVVSGTVTNQTSDIYGMPDVMIVLRDADGRVISHQKFMPSATLIDAGATSDFKYTLSAPVSSNIKSIDARLVVDGGKNDK